MEDDDDIDDEYGDVPDRESIKRHSLSLLSSRKQNKQSKKTKKKRMDDL